MKLFCSYLKFEINILVEFFNKNSVFTEKSEFSVKGHFSLSKFGRFLQPLVKRII